LAALALSLAALGGWWFLRKPPPAAPSRDDPPAVVPLSPSPYLNTRPGVEYVGSAACTRCHPAEHSSYQRTGMSRSVAEVRPDKEPPDGAADHAASGRRFQAYRRGGQLRHRELLLAGARGEVVLDDFPLKYAIGSGRHGRTYAVEADGFLVESPLSWYSARKRWGTSPGYEAPGQWGGFERAVGIQCVYCHFGRVEVLERSFHRYRVVEPAVGCERCHGPGGLHVARWDKPAGEAGSGEADRTIVNPARLGRDLAEAVCQQCHLGGDMVVAARGRRLSDYRPGLPL